MTTPNRGGAREGAGPKEKFVDQARLSVGIEQVLMDALDAWRKEEEHLIERKTGGKSRRYKDCPEGMQPMPRSDVVTAALEEFLGVSVEELLAAKAKEA